MSIRLLFLVSLLVSYPAWTAESVLYRWDFERDAEGWRAEHDVAGLAARDGVLRFSTTGRDAYISVAGGRRPVARANVLRFRMRSNRAGQTQVHFSTTASPNPAAHEVPFVEVEGDNQWRTYEVRMLGLDGWSGRLTMLRLDPVNPAADARVEIDWVELATLAPLLRIERLAPDRTRIAPGERFVLRFSVRNAGGPMECRSVHVALYAAGAEIVDGATRVLRFPSSREVAEATWQLSANTGEDVRLAARVVDASGGTLASATLRLPMRDGGDEPEFDNGQIGIAFRDGTGAQLFARDGEGWKRTALCRPLARVAVGEPPEQTDVQFAGVERRGDTLTLSGTATSRNLPVRLTLRFDGPFIHCRAELTGRGDTTLLHFSGPTLLVDGTSKREALFPGVEYLNANEPSSRADIIGRRFAPRTVPAAHWITAPVMAVQTDAGLSALLWEPTREWTPGHARPAAAFASPNLLDEQGNHLMQLFVPGVGDGTEPNERTARMGFPLSATSRVTLESTLFATTRATDTIAALEAWARLHPIPDVPAPPHDATRTVEICMRGFRDTLYEPGEGWTVHWGLGETPRRIADFIRRLAVHAHRTGDATWLTHTDLSLQDTMLEVLGPLERQAGSTPPQIARQRPDGTWPYHEGEELKEKTRKISRGESHTLGQEGTTNVGVCTVNALPVLRHALAWGDAPSMQSGKRALEAMLAFRVPAGAQTWEVHKDIPDVNAAGHAVECFRIGYELWDDPRYLDAAVYWARTGLPFIYLWEAPVAPRETTVLFNAIRGREVDDFTLPAGECYENPRREIMPYASIPVLGTSFYVVRWYGHPVQWCGLVWAEAVLDLLNAHGERMDVETAALLRKVALGVLNSARWQQLDKPPYAGLLPDSWLLESNTAFPAMIGPMRIHDTLLAAERQPSWRSLNTRMVGDLHITSYAQTTEPHFKDSRPSGDLRFKATYLAGQPYEIAVSGCTAPNVVHVDGQVVEYRHLEDRRLFLLTLTGTGTPQKIDAEW